jgi:hypothetical protein
MPIETNAPPMDRRPTRPVGGGKYQSFMDAIRAAGSAWVSLPLEEVTGASNARKQTTIHTAAAGRGIRVATTIQEGRLFARLMPNPQ